MGVINNPNLDSESGSTDAKIGPRGPPGRMPPKASSGEIPSGFDDVKYITPKGLKPTISNTEGRITGNTGRITNTTLAASNLSKINTNIGNITSNMNKSTSNASAIATNMRNIASNTSWMTNNTKGISSNSSQISTNTRAISGNSAKITSNMGRISILQSRPPGGGSGGVPFDRTPYGSLDVDDLSIGITNLEKRNGNDDAIDSIDYVDVASSLPLFLPTSRVVRAETTPQTNSIAIYLEVDDKSTLPSNKRCHVLIQLFGQLSYSSGNLFRVEYAHASGGEVQLTLSVSYHDGNRYFRIEANFETKVPSVYADLKLDKFNTTGGMLYVYIQCVLTDVAKTTLSRPIYDVAELLAS